MYAVLADAFRVSDGTSQPELAMRPGEGVRAGLVALYLEQLPRFSASGPWGHFALPHLVISSCPPPPVQSPRAVR